MAMANPRQLTMSVADLDEMGCCEAYAEFRPKLLAANPNPNHANSIDDFLDAGCHITNVRDLLFPVARLAQTDLRIRTRLTLLINDYAIRSLPTFEARFPGDPRPRRAIEATQQFASGGLSQSEWKPAAHAGLKAWAAFYAPSPIFANGMWAAVSSGAGSFVGWKDISEDELYGWLGWAEWAALCVKLHLVEQHGGTDAYDSADIDPPWTIRRLVAWARKCCPVPLSLPPDPPITTKPAHELAQRVGTYELDWSFFTVFPEGVKEIDSIQMDRNSFVCIPDGVQHIGEIYLCDDAGELIVPNTVRRIDELTLNYGSNVKLLSGLKSIGSLVVNCDGELILPDGIQSIGSIKTRLDLDLPLSIEHVGSIEFDPDDEGMEPPLTVSCGAIEIIANTRNLSFPGPVAD